jgi:hypothetical protein
VYQANSDNLTTNLSILYYYDYVCSDHEPLSHSIICEANVKDFSTKFDSSYSGGRVRM